MSRLPSGPCLHRVCAWAISTPGATVLCSISHAWLGFKTPILKGPAGMDPLHTLSGETQCAVSHPVLSQKSCCTAAQLLGVYGEAQRKSSNQIIYSLCMFLSLTDKNPFSGTYWVFVLGETIYLLLEVLQERNHSLPM